MKASLIIAGEDPGAEGIGFLNTSEVMTVSGSMSRDGEPEVFPTGDMPADILFTTGTTGKSKGVQLSHLSLMTMARTSIEGTQMEPDNVYLVTVPMNHAGGIRKLHMTMYNGSSIVLLDGLMRIKLFFQYIQEYGVTSIYLPPSAVHMLLQLSGREISRYNSQLRFIYTGSAAYPETDKEKLCQLLPDVRLYNGYGGSEIGSVSMLDYNQHKGMVGCIGRPNSAVTVRITDEDRNSIASDAEHIGLLAVSSDMNMQCYWNEPELTKETMEDGWIYTSDLGYIDRDGYIFLVGRSGDVINVGGLKVAPTEVEETALRYEGIADCVCTSTDDKHMGKVVRLLVVMKDGWELNPGEIQNMLRQHLEAYKVPKYIDQIDEVPRTFNGKIDRKRLPK
ncbi:MAG: long-chain fatty acid--CoA ligase [Clostridia bacterium]|nr:long-chain fatty acid--CoA ligase [Clostridia bacterium]